MSLKRIMGVAVFAVVLTSGCRSWCERHYCPGSCAPSGYYAPPAPPQQCCVPCYCPPQANYAPQGNWTRPAPANNCCP